MFRWVERCHWRCLAEVQRGDQGELGRGPRRCRASYEDAKAKGAEDWDATKDATAEAWEGTKEASREAWDETAEQVEAAKEAESGE